MTAAPELVDLIDTALDAAYDKTRYPDRSWLAGLDEAAYHFDGAVVFITQECWDSLNSYDCSYPTSPSPGRVWRCRPGVYDPTYDGPDYLFVVGPWETGADGKRTAQWHRSAALVGTTP